MAREIIPRYRRTPDEIAEKRKSLLAIVEGAARNGHCCPSLMQLALLLRINPKTVHALFLSLRNDGAISWSMVFGFGAAGQKVRVVTIKATGMKTAPPGHGGKRRGRPAKVVELLFIGPPVRILEGVEKAKWADYYEKRDAERRAKQSLYA